MKQLVDFKENIHKCSKCGICQGECPIYQVTGNDCAVSRGMFVMLRGCLNGELKLNKNINRYLELCLKCSACSKFCPSGVDAVDIIIAAKQEYFKKNFIERDIPYGDYALLYPSDKIEKGCFSYSDKERYYNSREICGISDIFFGYRPEELEFWKSLGLDMIFSGGDWSFLYAKATEVLKLL